MAHKLYTLLYIAVCIYLVTDNVYCEAEEEGSGGEGEDRFKVLHLTDKTFDKYMEKNIDKDVLIMFYAPWCGHCKKMKPAFEEVYHQVKKGPQVLVAVDCTVSKKVASRFKITSYPTLKFFRKGTLEELPFYGQRTKEGILSFLAKPVEEQIFANAPPALRLLTADQFDGFIKETPSALVMFYAPWCGHCKQLGPVFMDAAKKVSDEGTGVLAAIDCVKYPEMNKRFNISAYPVVKHFKDGIANLEYNGKRTLKDIVDFMKNPAPYVEPPAWKETKSDVAHLQDSTFDSFVDENQATLVMFYAPWCSHCQAMKDDFTKAASTVKTSGKGVLAAVDGTTETALKERFQLKSFPTLKYIRKGKPVMDYTGGRGYDDIVEFMTHPVLSWSETATDVAHLNSSSFDSYISQNSPVLVMFYAPWCKHCNNLKSPFADISTKVKESKLGSFAAVDCTVDAKICDDRNVDAYPTLKYFVDGEIKYEYGGKLDADGLYSFMQSPKTAEPPPPPPQEQWNEDVIQLTDKSFDNFIQQNKAVLVMFYAPWCGHCKNMKPNFMEAASKVKQDGLGVLAAVDCTAQKEVAQKYSISGYPTTKYFKNGKEEMNYSGDRSVNNIIEFMKKPNKPTPPPPAEPFSTEPTEVEVLNDSNFDNFVNTNDKVLVMFYAPWCGHCKNMKPAYIEAAAKVKEQKLGVLAAVDATSSPTLASKYKVEGYPTLKYFKNGKEEMEYTHARTVDALLGFMKNPTESAPPPPAEPFSAEPNEVQVLNDQNFEDFVKTNDAVLVMFYAPWCGHCKNMKPAYIEAASKVKEQGLGVLAAVDATSATGLASKYKIQSYPTIKFFKNGKEELEYKSARIVDDILNFMKNPTQPAAPPSPPAEPFATHPTEVEVLNDNNFDDFVKANDDVIVMFYAPWCGHCKNMKPDYIGAAAEVKEKGLAVLAAVDATVSKNLSTKFNIQGFPTLKYFKNGKEVADQKIPRSQGGILQFLYDHRASNKHDEL